MDSKTLALTTIVDTIRVSITSITSNLNFIKGESHINCDQCSSAMKEISVSIKQQNEMLNQLHGIISNET